MQDRIDTQFVGSRGRVADQLDQLDQLQEATGADELLITTITHGHADRVRSYELLAEEWHRRGHSFHPPRREAATSRSARFDATEERSR